MKTPTGFTQIAPVINCKLYWLQNFSYMDSVFEKNPFVVMHTEKDWLTFFGICFSWPHSKLQNTRYSYARRATPLQQQIHIPQNKLKNENNLIIIIY
jgi:hypothetical protein